MTEFYHRLPYDPSLVRNDVGRSSIDAQLFLEDTEQSEDIVGDQSGQSAVVAYLYTHQPDSQHRSGDDQAGSASRSDLRHSVRQCRSSRR